MHLVKPREIQIAPIHDVDRPGFQCQHIEHVHVAQFAVRDMNEGGNAGLRPTVNRLCRKFTYESC